MDLNSFIELKETKLEKPKIEEEKIVEASGKKVDEIEKMKQTLKGELYLWDMRCWEKYKDESEVLEWIEKRDESKNCGHARHCINSLLDAGVSKEEIKDLIMSNPFIQYKHRVVKCWNNPLSCPKYDKAGNYSDAGCEDCK